YTVYIHGTPEEKLFERTIRGFSSGCIRVQKPNELAHWVLNNENKWSLEKIQAAINSGRTQTILITKKIPVYFIYQTVWMDESGTIYFSQDHYHLDPPLLSALKLSSRPSTPEDEKQENS
ncbi:MAG TPA: L,D-transpeptidase family protein, partial [Candidatus Nitrosotenuis sp.]|nr:L,D-transpeptidase family protein [Candidatus Nitrosotenuis sp.]